MPRPCPRPRLARRAARRGRPPTAASLLGDLDRLAARLAAGARPALRDLAHALTIAPRDAGARSRRWRSSRPRTTTCLAKLGRSPATRSAPEAPEVADPRGVYFAERPAFTDGKVAFLFPGQGSQSVGDAAANWPSTSPRSAARFEEFDATLRAWAGEPRSGRGSSRPRPSTTTTPSGQTRPCGDRGRPAGPRRGERRPAPAARDAGRRARHGRRPQLWRARCALHAAGAIDVPWPGRALRVPRPAPARCGRRSSPARWPPSPTDPEVVAELIGDLADVLIVNLNGPAADGRRRAAATVIEAVLERAEGAEHPGRRLARGLRLPHAISWRPRGSRWPSMAIEVCRQARPAPSSRTSTRPPHPRDLRPSRARLGDHVTSPVRFAEMIEAMHEQGARVFVEVGPGRCAHAPDRLDPRRPAPPRRRLRCTRPGEPGRLPARPGASSSRPGSPVRLGPLTRGRAEPDSGSRPPPRGRRLTASASSTWMVNGSRAGRWSAPEPRRLGQARADAGRNIRSIPRTRPPGPSRTARHEGLSIPRPVEQWQGERKPWPRSRTLRESVPPRPSGRPSAAQEGVMREHSRTRCRSSWKSSGPR